ncbi:unnamed protein product [Adineta steineri]|uniref:F-box domain-containing protein n=1 Tax=Adineta steineri TaxID=433720 RepID=A0A814BYY4_9BILA|nr:unnamed protein product [Adineta steineri]CAF3758507.1 unnamed protein product [Adineta steineri]
MNVDNSCISIVDLPDEILLSIFNKLSNFDVLYWLVGVNIKLDNIARDRKFTQSIDLTSISSSEKDDPKTNAILDRFCLDILPRIHNNVKCLTIDGCFLERILHSNKFFNLQTITLINLDVNMASHILNENNPFVINFKQQLSELIIRIDYEDPSVAMLNLLIDIYHRTFALFSNLKYLDLDVNNRYFFFKPLLSGLSPTACISSSITHLCIKLHNIDDCLRLLDGRLNQLHTFIVKLEFIHDPELLRHYPSEITHNASILLNNTKNVEKLKCFSLCACIQTTEFDNLVIPLVHRLSHLEKLTLSLRVSERYSYIDATYLENSLLRQIPYLQTFFFDIATEYVYIDGQVRPSFNDIRHTFIQRGYNVDGYIDSMNSINTIWNRYHVYSFPFHMECIHPISHGFPGGMFMNVANLRIRDMSNSFEHSFFAKISRSFPLLRRLSIQIKIEKKEKSEEVSSIIEFSHLVELKFISAHIDYVEQFLPDMKTRLPSLIKLIIRYEHLATITENFTRNSTRINCAKLKSIEFHDETPMIHSKDFYLYFPLL